MGADPIASDDGVLPADALDSIIRRLCRAGYEVVGPTVKDGAIVLDRITAASDLPRGVKDIQDAGTYRLADRQDAAYFGYVVGPHAWKRYLFPSDLKLFAARREEGSFTVDPPSAPPRYAFLGARACDLAAIACQDRIFLQGAVPDPTYRDRRRDAFIVAVHCAEPSATCFCVSMGTGPRAEGAFDLALSELCTPERHDFLVQTGTERGRALLEGLPVRPATEADRCLAAEITLRAEAAMKRSLDTRGLRDLLLRNLEHPRWDDVAERCLACANCTLVCPTCFCSNVEDTTDLRGDHAERWRRWDSCFTLEFSQVHGQSVRSSVRSRYRQWMTHKLATWHDQFQTSGCVGCGRCITWCPVGIDITEEARAIRETEEVACP